MNISFVLGKKKFEDDYKLSYHLPSRTQTPPSIINTMREYAGGSHICTVCKNVTLNINISLAQVLSKDLRSDLSGRVEKNVGFDFANFVTAVWFSFKIVGELERIGQIQ